MALPIRKKLNLFIWLITGAVSALCLVLLGTLYLHVRDFNGILGDSYQVNHALVSFKAENNAFIDLFQSANDETLTLYQDARQETRASLAQLSPDYEKHGIDRYLVTQAIQSAYRYYGEECNFLLSASAQDTAYASRYYAALDVADYIDGYFRQLMQSALDEGTATYSERLRSMRVVPVVSVSLSLFTLLLAGFLGWVTNRDVVRPVLQMANIAARIAENDLDSPDVTVENLDEIGRLALIFNRMKDSMRKYILTLQEVNQMEARLYQEDLQKVEMEEKLKSMQLSMLQSQINPHFLFNTLGTIRSTAKIEDARYTEELIQRLANLFRYNLQTSDAIVPLEREIAIIEDYIYIQRRRFGLRLRFVMDSRVKAGRVGVPAFTLQPLVENAIIHGIAPKEEGGSVRVQIFERQGVIHIRVTDTGLGISHDRLDEMLGQTVNQQGHLSHIGIGNVRSRLAILFPGSTLRVQSRMGLGTSVRLEIPLGKEKPPHV
jgi:sensor histidine kinase YesM